MQVAILQQNKTLTKVLLEYANYTDMFLFKLVIEIIENISINKYAIELENDK